MYLKMIMFICCIIVSVGGITVATCHAFDSNRLLTIIPRPCMERSLEERISDLFFILRRTIFQVTFWVVLNSGKK